MAKEQISVEVEKSAYEMIEALSRAAKAVKAAKASGMSGELAAIAAFAVSELPGLIVDAQGLPSDLAESKIAFIKGANIALYDLAEALYS